MRRITRLVCASIFLLAANGVEAQWIKHRTPGLPRLADGKPNLDAPVPRTADGKPDFSGLWKNDGGDRYYNNILADLKTSDVAPWAHELFMKRSLEFGKDSMETQCLPLGPAYLTTRYRDYRIVQTPTLIMVAYEDGMHRQIWMDGRSLEPEPNPTWMGYSVGRWDGDTLVVESNGFTERSWLDFGGHPHTEALRITERYTRRTVGRLEVQITLTDAKVFAKPITLTIPIKLLPDTEMLEGFCENHHKSRERMASTKAATVVNVPAATLSRYIGSYQTDESYDGMTHDMAVTLDGSELWFDYEGKGKELLIALTPARFSWSGSIVEFSSGSAGAMNITIHYVEGTERGVRRK